MYIESHPFNMQLCKHFPVFLWLDFLKYKQKLKYNNPWVSVPWSEVMMEVLFVNPQITNTTAMLESECTSIVFNFPFHKINWNLTQNWLLKEYLLTLHSLCSTWKLMQFWMILLSIVDNYMKDWNK